VAIGISATGDASLTVKLERWPWPWRGDQTEATQKHQRLLHQFGGFSCARELGKKGEVRSKACAGADFGIRWDVADLTNGVDQEEEGYFRDGCGPHMEVDFLVHSATPCQLPSHTCVAGPSRKVKEAMSFPPLP
jgi:hypothetical protein